MEKAKVLIIDDDITMLELLKRGLCGLGYAVETAENDSEMRRILEKLRPDIILMDVSMPGIDGISLCREMRRSPGLTDIPILMLSAFSDEKTVHDAMLFGANGFLCKPCEPAKLGSCIEEILKKSNSGRSES
jgi:DNA-binding response OmpR family regulator